MIVTVTPNPAMDKIYLVPQFRPGRSFHAKDVQISPGGRGVNVSQVLKQLDYDSIATGFLAGHTGEYIRTNLCEQGITTNFTKVSGENRTNLYVIDEIGGVESGLTELGPAVTSAEYEHFLKNLDRLLPRVTCLITGGSLPPGVPSDFFYQVTERARYHNIRVLVDTFGSPLNEAIRGQPNVVKIDQRYMNAVDGIQLSSIDNLLLISKKIFDQGVDWILSSYFSNTSIFYTTRGAFMAEIPRKNVISLFGANDSLMAAMAVAISERMGVEDTIKFAMSSVLEDVQHLTKGVPSRRAIEKSIDSVKLSKIS